MSQESTQPNLEFNPPAGDFTEGTTDNVTNESPDAWLSTFKDEQLDNLVALALDRNYDVRIAATRVENARSMATISGAGRLPSADLSVGARRAGFVDSDRGKFVDEDGDGVIDEGYSYSYIPDTHALSWSFNVRWEADLWGKLNDTAAASLAEFQASQADYRAMRLSIAASTTRAWYNAITALQQYRLAEETLSSYQNTARLIERRFETGISSALELRLALTSVANARARVASSHQQLKAAQRSLQILTGNYPDGYFSLNETLPELEVQVPVGLPSSLLHRRPDIIAAERRLVASDKRLSASRKDLIPSIALTGSIESSDGSLSNLFIDDTWYWNLLGSLTQPLYKGKRLKAAAESARVDTERALLSYGKTVLNAFNEVEQALASEIFLADRETALNEARLQSQAAEELAWDEYTSGISDIITVLESQRRAVEAKTQYITSRNQRIQNRIDLFLALGGSFGISENFSSNNSNP